MAIKGEFKDEKLGKHQRPWTGVRVWFLAKFGSRALYRERRELFKTPLNTYIFDNFESLLFWPIPGSETLVVKPAHRIRNP